MNLRVGPLVHNTIQLSCGTSYTPLIWFKSYLSDRSQMVFVGDSRSKWARVKLDIPQGSVLGPILFPFHYLYGWHPL